MIKKLCALAVGSLLAASSQAAFITGSLSFGGGFDEGGFPTPPSSSIVSALTGLNVNNLDDVFTAGSGTNDFDGVDSALAFDILPPALPTTIFTAAPGGFTFKLSTFTVSSTTPLSCSEAGLCKDGREWSLAGTVTGDGFDATAFIGILTAQGTCLGAGASCASDASASWSASITATGKEPPRPTPEPATLALLGIGLAGLSFARRRKG